MLDKTTAAPTKTTETPEPLFIFELTNDRPSGRH